MREGGGREAGGAAAFAATAAAHFSDVSLARFLAAAKSELFSSSKTARASS